MSGMPNAKTVMVSRYAGTSVRRLCTRCSVILTFEINLEKACKYAEIFVPLHRQKMKRQRWRLGRKIARIKSKNCAH